MIGIASPDLGGISASVARGSDGDCDLNTLRTGVDTVKEKVRAWLASELAWVAAECRRSVGGREGERLEYGRQDLDATPPHL
jgi:hypothetical protein